MIRSRSERIERIDALEREMETVRTAMVALAGQAAAANARADMALERLAEVTKQLAEFEAGVTVSDATLLLLDEQVQKLGNSSEDQDEVVKKLLTRLEQIELQARIDAEEALKVNAGLWKRIEERQFDPR